MNQPHVVTARSPRRTPRQRDDHMTLRVFPGASTSIASGISNHRQQFYPNSSQQHNTHHQHRNPPSFMNHPHMQGFANTPVTDDTTMQMDMNIS